MADSRPLRLMTYNIRHGRGWDGKVDLGRIVAAIETHDPDVITLQEVDAGRLRSGAIDQADRLANRLGMDARFVPCLTAGDERYGIATLSRLPIRTHDVISLPKSVFGSEPRRALVTAIDVEGRELDVVNTHFSLRPLERALQARALDKELSSADDVLLAGDFNCTPLSGVYRRLITRLQEAGPRRSTWPSRRPFLQLDHVLYRGADLRLRDAHVAISPLTRQASDHLPVVTTFEPFNLVTEGVAS